MVEAQIVRLVRLGPLLLSAACLLAPRPAGAVDVVDLGGETLTLDVTNTAIVSYHFDNRNGGPVITPDPLSGASVARFFPGGRVDDAYGSWVDRLNIQANWWRLRLGLRVDAATYFLDSSSEDAADLAARDDEDAQAAGVSPLDPTTRNERANEYRRELHSRYLNTYYLSKLWLGYAQPGLDVTVGDFYAQLGRGLVLSVRKIDELAVDTTIRGGKIVADHDFGPLRVGTTLLAGQMNPVRIDETSGRRLHGDGSPLFFGFPETGDLVTYGFGEFGNTVEIREGGRPSYLEDTIYGGRLEVGGELVSLAVNGSWLARKSYAREYLECLREPGRDESDCGSEFPDFSSNKASRAHDVNRTLSWSLSLPNIAEHGDIYVEVARQELSDGHLASIDPDEREPDISGYAGYASATARGGPVTLTLEGKHYRSFFPLAANIDSTTKGFGAPELDLVAYSQPPTAEPNYVEQISGSPNVCMTGGRGRLDYRFVPEASVYGWVGYYASRSEVAQNDRCKTLPDEAEDAKLRTHTWDAAVGTDLDFENKKSHARAWGGARITDRDAESDSNTSGRPTAVFYREGYVRYDLVKHLSGPFSVQAQGVHRRRYEPTAFAEAWYEGENYTALHWSPHFAAIVGYEYLTKEGCAVGEDTEICHYVNGGLQWRAAGGESIVEKVFDTVNLFVGQRRGAIRCVSGVCRLFPPFEGARLELVSKF